jgi:hypothetical protein
MTTEAEGNRSSALTPEQLGAINNATASAVKSALEAVMSGLIPVFQGMQLTPEKIQEMKKPYVDPAKMERDLREAQKTKEDAEEASRLTAARKAGCPHLDKNGRSSINISHNHPDHQPRGICVICHDWITPKEWRIGAPTKEFPRGKAFVAEPHKDYRIVMQLESMN